VKQQAARFYLKKTRVDWQGGATAKNWCETDLALMGDNTVVQIELDLY
jgi:hypothetical protein